MEAEIRVLRERLSKLCAAVLRISASLDLDTVLREVVESARALTGARYGGITTIDKAGQAHRHLRHHARRAPATRGLARLTATEYDLLRVLSTNAGRVVTYEKLLRSVWRSRSSGDARPVRAFVKKLRRKLGDDASNPTYIFTEPRVGYRMHRPDDASEAASVYK